MRIDLTVGKRTVTIDTGWNDGEENETWLSVMQEVVWPAMRGFGFIIDDEFTEKLGEYHDDYIDRKYKNKIGH